jgi:hypothetical protein
MVFMGLVEQRVHEVCDIFARKVKQQAVDFGPQVSTGDHTVNVSPPNAEDADMDDSDDDEDEIKMLEEHQARPLSVEEMKAKAEKKWKPAAKMDSPAVMGTFFGGASSNPSLGALGTPHGGNAMAPQGRDGRSRGSVIFIGKQQGKASNAGETLGATL